MLTPGNKGQLDRKIWLELEKAELPTHLEGCLWLKLLSENEYRVHTTKKPMGKGKIISTPYGVKCPICEAMIEGTNERGCFHFVYAILDALSGCNLKHIATKYKLKYLEGKNLDELYEELQKHNFIGIIDTRKKTFTKYDDAPTDLPPIDKHPEDPPIQPLTKFMEGP